MWDTLAHMTIRELMNTYPYMGDFLAMFPEYEQLFHFTITEFFA